MKYLVIKTVLIKEESIIISHEFQRLRDATLYIRERCNDENVINIIINFIKDERTNQIMG